MLAPGGVFVTQQVGGRDEAELLGWFGRASPEGPEWDLELATRQLEESGLEVTAGGEADPSRTFADVGALVYYLNAVPWRVPGITWYRAAPAGRVALGLGVPGLR